MSFVIVVLVGIFCVFCACFFQGCEKTTMTTTTVESVKSMSRADVEKMLQKLERQETSKPYISALCYAPAPVLKKAEYVCPACGQKTIYTTPRNTSCVTYDVSSARREFPILQKASKLKMGLDESRFCKRCHPVTTPPELVLKITYSDGSVHEAEVSAWDLEVLTAFFKGASTVRNGPDDEPLKENLSSLRRILGFEKSDTEKKQ